MIIQWIKYLHICCAMLSFMGFFVRGIWTIQGSPRLQFRWVKIVPHVIDSLLLISALLLLYLLNISPLVHAWLAVKILMLLVYIGLGMMALHHGRTRRQQATAWVLALLVFLFIVSVALTHSPWGIMSYIYDNSL